MTGESKNLAQADEKFLFHMNNFDEELIEEEALEDLPPPPPPTFSEAELQAAKDEAYAKGLADATKEEQGSRSQFVALMLEKIAAQTQALFAQEENRERVYEQEAVRLSLSVFEQVFPVYHDTQGFNELQDQLLGVLKSQDGQKTIQIRVAPSYSAGIEAFMNKLSERDADLRFTVSGDEGIAEGAVHVGWDDGGAVRDAKAMAAQIRDRIQEILAGAGATSHDEIVSAPPADTPPAPIADNAPDIDTETVDQKTDEPAQDQIEEQTGTPADDKNEGA